MIEINLLGQKKPFTVPLIMGIDLTKINCKLIIIAIIFNQLPDFLVYPEWADEIKVKQGKLSEFRKKLTALEKEVKSHSDVRKKLEAFNRQVRRLNDRSTQVQKIIQERTNPASLLEKIARVIPGDLWLTALEIKNDKKINLFGQSTSYKSIGNFITSSNESAFFGRSLNLTDSKTVEDTGQGKGKRVENFSIAGNITSFDPWR